MHTKSDKTELLIGYETDKIIEDLFDSFLQRYQEKLEESTKEGKCVLIIVIQYTVTFTK